MTRRAQDLGDGDARRRARDDRRARGRDAGERVGARRDDEIRGAGDEHRSRTGRARRDSR